MDKDIVIIASSDMSHKEVNNAKQYEKFKEFDKKAVRPSAG